MSQRSLSAWLKVITLVVAAVAVLFFFFLLPELSREIVERAPEYAVWRQPCLILAWCMSAPCFVALALFWLICTNIGRDRSFSRENGRYLTWISRLAIFDSVFLLAVSVFLASRGLISPGYAFVELVLIIAGVGIGIISASLSHMVAKACRLQDESDLTI